MIKLSRAAFAATCRSKAAPAALLTCSLASGLLAAGTTQPVRANSPAVKTDSFLQKTLDARPKLGWTGVIARFTTRELTAAQTAQLTALRADVVKGLPFINSAALRVPSRNLSRLAALPFVAHLSLDSDVRKSDEFTVGSSGADVAMMQYGVTGSGVTVAVLDSGVHSCDDLKNVQPPAPLTLLPGQVALPKDTRLYGQVSFVPNDSNADDKCGHGTHVAGIIGGNGKASTGEKFFRTFYGIAPQSEIVNVRVLDKYGSGNVSSVLAGLQWIIVNKAKYNIRVLNISFGHPVGESYKTDPLCQAVEACWKTGIVVVCAAGNEGRLNDTSKVGADNEGFGTSYGSIQSPGNDPYVLTVGATKSMDGNRAHDKIATYSSRGPSRLDMTLKPDIVAPGNRVISLDAKDSYLDTAYVGSNQIPMSLYSTKGDNTSDKYFRLSGTSMAAPVVAGAAALLIQANPSLSPDTIKARLMISADKWNDASGVTNPCTFGAGYLNIPAALASTVVATQPALSPTLSEDIFGNVTINMDRAVWGNRAIWGTGSVTDLRAVWGKQAIWGTSTLTSSRAVWGKSVWSDRAVWGSSFNSVDLSYTALVGEN